RARLPGGGAPRRDRGARRRRDPAGAGAAAACRRVRRAPSVGADRRARGRGRRGRPHAVLAGVVPPPRGAGTRAAGVPRGGGSRGWSGGALRADRLTLVLVGQLAAVVHQEAAGAGELVGLTGQHPDAQLLAREVGTGELEPLGGLGLVLVDRTRVLLGTARLELLQRVLAELLVGLARCVVVGRHNVLLRPSSSSSGRGSAPVGRSRTRVQRTASRIVPARGRRDCAPSGGTLH